MYGQIYKFALQVKKIVCYTRAEGIIHERRMYLFPQTLILVKGGGEFGTGIAWRLHKAGFPIILTEPAAPPHSSTVAFARAIDAGEIAVEGVTAWRVDFSENWEQETRRLLEDEMIPVLVDPDDTTRMAFHPTIIIDARMAERNTDTNKKDAPLVIGVGAGLIPGLDCHCVIETQRGHNLGRVLWHAHTAPHAGENDATDAYAPREPSFTIGYRALALGGGALEAVLEWMKIHSGGS